MLQTSLLLMKRLNKTETPIFLSVVCSIFPKAIFLTFIILKLIWICAVCKGRICPGSAGQGLISFYYAAVCPVLTVTILLWKREVVALFFVALLSVKNAVFYLLFLLVSLLGYVL